MQTHSRVLEQLENYKIDRQQEALLASDFLRATAAARDEDDSHPFIVLPDNLLNPIYLMTLFERLIAAGEVKAFFWLYGYVKHEINDENLKKLWRYIIESGQADFFDEQYEQAAALKRYIELSQAVTKEEGPLHFAVRYDVKATQELIKNKKKIVRRLLELGISVNCQNDQGKTALMLAAENGYYETGKELLKLKIDSISVEDLDAARKAAARACHQRMEEAIIIYKLNKRTSDFATPKNRIAQSSLEKAIDVSEEQFDDLIAKNNNINISEDKFISLLKKSTDLNYQQISGILVSRIDKLKGKYAWRHGLLAVFGVVCPSIVIAELVSSFAPVFSLGAILIYSTLGALLPFYAWNVYSRYKTLSVGYSQQQTEIYYRTWLTAKLQKLNNDLNAISTQLAVADISDERKKELQERFKKIEAEIDSCVKLNGNKKELQHSVGTLHAHLLPKKEYQYIKQLAADDPVSNSRLAGPFGSFKAAGSYTTEVLCSVGALMSLGSVITSLVVGKTGGLLFLGAAAASFLTGPVAAVIIPILAVIALCLIVGTALYKSAYQQERRDIGERHRDLVSAHDAFKHNFDHVNKKRRAIRAQLSNQNKASGKEEGESVALTALLPTQKSSVKNKYYGRFYQRSGVQAPPNTPAASPALARRAQ